MFFRRQLKPRGMYIVEQGDRTGCFLLYVKEANIGDTFAFLCMPHPLETLYLTNDDVKNSLRHGSMKLFKTLPKDVYDVCAANFNWLKKKED